MEKNQDFSIKGILQIQNVNSNECARTNETFYYKNDVCLVHTHMYPVYIIAYMMYAHMDAPTAPQTILDCHTYPFSHQLLSFSHPKVQVHINRNLDKVHRPTCIINF